MIPHCQVDSIDDAIFYGLATCLFKGDPKVIEVFEGQIDRALNFLKINGSHSIRFDRGWLKSVYRHRRIGVGFDFTHTDAPSDIRDRFSEMVAFEYKLPKSPQTAQYVDHGVIEDEHGQAKYGWMVTKLP